MRLLPLLLVLGLTGCSIYVEQFSFTNRPGDTNVVFRGTVRSAAYITNFLSTPAPTNEPPKLYTVKVKHLTFFQWGRAAKLETATVTKDFLRTVNGEGLATGVDAEAIKAVSEGVTEGALKFFVPKP
jgi:hypothetical protein